jgi:uncharacterized protein YbaP (TraB family)
VSARPARAAGALAAVILTAGLTAGAARAQPPVWTIHGQTGEVVLFGSVHLLPRGVDWRPPALTAALARADAIWFELPLDQATSETAARLARKRERLPVGDSLWAHLTPAETARLTRAAARVGVPVQALGALRPWMADLALSTAQDAQAGAVAAEGVEARLQSDAPPGARRHALETVTQQIGFLAGGGLDDQIASLDETAREITEEPDLFHRTVTAWLAGDLAALEREDLAPMRAAAPAAYRRLILERNRRWTRILARLARRPGVTVVVVGAGHLIGPDGVPAGLRAAGLAVEGP